MARPPLRRGITIHDIPQSRQQDQDLANAHNELREIKEHISCSPTLHRKESKRILKRINQLSPPIKSHSFQRDLVDTSTLLGSKSRYRRANVRIQKIIERGDIVPTLGEIINEICKTENIRTIVQFAVEQPADSWNNTNVNCLIYSGGSIRPRALMTSHLISEEIVQTESPDSVLRTDNLIARLLVAWSCPIVYTCKMSKRPVRTAKRILLEAFDHLLTTNIDYAQLLQKQIYSHGLQRDNVPIVLVNLFLRFYVPEFRQQYSRYPDTIGQVCVLIQSTINGHVSNNNVDGIRASKRISSKLEHVIDLFKNA